MGPAHRSRQYPTDRKINERKSSLNGLQDKPPNIPFYQNLHSFDLNRFVFVQHSIAKSLPHLLRPTLIEPGMFLPWNNRDIMRNVHSLFNHSGSLLMEWLWVSMRLIHNDTMDNSISASKPDNFLIIFSSISTGHSHFYVNVSSTT